MEEFTRQLMIAAAFEAYNRGPTYNTPEAVAAWEFYKDHSTGSERDAHSRILDDYLNAAIRHMARSDARSLGAPNEPAFDDAVEVWTDLHDDADAEDRWVAHALRTFMDKHARQVYRDEWSRIRAEFYGFIK